MKNSNAEPDMITYSTLVKGYCIVGELDRAFDIFEETRDGVCIPRRRLAGCQGGVLKAPRSGGDPGTAVKGGRGTLNQSLRKESEDCPKILHGTALRTSMWTCIALHSVVSGSPPE